jgi:hypothetical protein
MRSFVFLGENGAVETIEGRANEEDARNHLPASWDRGPHTRSLTRDEVWKEFEKAIADVDAAYDRNALSPEREKLKVRRTRWAYAASRFL